MRYCIVGVVGHIDHGKTSLVKTLTGTDTDTHPEEKRRGITIDLGFAYFRDGDDVFAMIDAPGHQKYIGNLLSGVSQVDIGLMVVAADQGIQAQTLEHTSILSALGVKKLLVVISRTDLCTSNQVNELAEELQLFLADEGFDDFPILPVSVVTGQGIEALKSAMRSAAWDEVADADLGAESLPFRMPIDRVFSVPGRGCVVAGTIWSGSVSDGETVHLADGRPVRVREIETHSQQMTSSIAGRRTAMNLVGVSAHDVSRGDELISKDRLRLVTQLIVDLSVNQNSGEIKCPTTCHIHTAAVACEARIVGVRKLTAGQRQTVIVETSQGVVATFGQRCLFRRPYPVGSFASGKVLAAIVDGESDRQKRKEFAQSLTNADEPERLLGWVDHYGELSPNAPWLPSQIGVSKDQLISLATELIAANRCAKSKSGKLVSFELINGTKKHIVNRLTRQATESDNAWIKTESLIETVTRAEDTAVATMAIDSLLSEKEIVTTTGMIALATDATQLSKRQLSRLNQIIQSLATNRAPSTKKHLASELEFPAEQLKSLSRFACEQGVLVDIGGEFLYHADVLAQLVQELHELLVDKTEVTAADVRDHWQLSRKHVIPLLEHCDRYKITLRNGAIRTAGPAISSADQGSVEP